MQDGDPNKVLSLSEMTVAGALSGVVIAFVLCPVELVKVRLQVQRTSLKASASSTLPISMQPVLLFYLLLHANWSGRC